MQNIEKAEEIYTKYSNTVYRYERVRKIKVGDILPAFFIVCSKKACSFLQIVIEWEHYLGENRKNYHKK